MSQLPQLNYSALDRKYTFSELHHHTIAEIKKASRGKVWKLGGNALLTLSIILLGLLANSAVSGRLSVFGAAFMFWNIAFYALIALIGYYIYLTAYMKSRLRLKNFCKDNSFEFLPDMKIGEQSGVIFTKGHSKKAKNGIRGIRGAGFILFDYQYTTGSGKTAQTYNIGVVKIRLDRKFPHILLDNKGDLSVRGYEFDSSQKLKLEGDFNKHFDVYGPKEYEIEVLQILNPAVMQTLIDIPEAADIEIVGHDLYIYNFGGHGHRRTLESLFTVIEQVMSSTASVQKSFSMPAQIGTYKPTLKRSKTPLIIFIIFSLFVFFVIVVPWVLTILSIL